MVRYAAEHEVVRVEDLQGFDFDGYRFDAARSDVDVWEFVRDEV
jgi:cytoplasmic iron level regulating protein YaaA (DUF328/UPF0246 family)